MAGLEIVVRPLIFPDIRPVRSRPALPPQDDPTKGFAVIQGDPTVSTSSSDSWSISSSHSRPKEVERRVDEARVYQKEDDGTVNKDNFVDVQVANKITMEEPGGGGGEGEMKEYFYERIRQQEENIEVKRRDVILRNGEEFKG